MMKNSLSHYLHQIDHHERICDQRQIFNIQIWN